MKIVTKHMAKKFKISEEQYNLALSEGIQINANPSKGQDTGSAVKSAVENAKNSGMKTDDAQVVINANDVNEGKKYRTITKKQLQEERLRYLQENSEVYTFEDFVSKLN